ncbi:MAG: response regulator [Desulfobacterales bacterium]|nr:response regulator [Desulfobacterales bacterium]
MFDSDKPPVILTIDDESSIRDSFRAHLEDYEYEVLEAKNGRIGLEVFEREKPDLILVDLRMPEVDGLEVLRNVTRRSPTTPIIVVSGAGEVRDAVEALRFGAWDYLLKPLDDLSVLLHAVERGLERARLLRENQEHQERLETLVARRTEELERANDELQQINTRLRLIVETTRDLSLCSEITNFGRQLLEEFSHHMLAEGGSLYLKEEKGLRLVHAIDPGHAPAVIPYPLREDSILKRAMDERRPILIHDIEESSELSTSEWEGYKNGSILAFPIPDELGRIIGVLSLHGKSAPPFTEQDKEIGSILASYSCEALRATRAVESLRESEMRLRAILNSLQTGVVVIDPETLEIVDVNPAAIEMIGAPKEEIVGKACHRYIGPFNEGRGPVDESGRRIDKSEQVLLTADGRETPILKTVTDVVLKGRRHLLEGFVDISRLKKAEEERTRLSTAIEQAAESFIIIGLDGKIEYVNPAFETISGYSRDEVLGKDADMLQGGGKNAAASRKIMETVIRGEIWQGRLRYEKKDGSEYTAEVTISPVRDDVRDDVRDGVRDDVRDGVRDDVRDESDAVVNIVVVARDVTREEQLEAKLRQAQKMESIGTLAGGIAHDFNNILSSVIGYTELSIADLPEENLVKSNLRAVLGAGERARDLVSQILTFSRQTEQVHVPVQVHLIAKEALKLLRSSLPATIEIRPSITDGGKVIADPTQVHQVIMNLCTNAFHAMQDSGGVLEVSLSRVEIGPREVEKLPDLSQCAHMKLRVSDTGAGMEKGVIDRIFDPYFTTKKKGQGTGLGLSVVHGIVRSHHGAVSVHSEVGEGSEFCIYLPIAETGEEGGAGKEEAPVGGAEAVLLVDDEKEIARVERKILERLGYSVATRTSSQDALNLFRENPGRFDAVITDLTMPNMTGDQLAVELLRIRPDLPVILCTGFSDRMDEERSRALGIRKFLMKPITIKGIAGPLREVLDDARD